MLKKIGISVLMVLVLAAGVTGLALAQEPTPPAEPPVEGECPPCPCEGFGEGPVGPGRRGRQRPEALVEALGMTAEELHEALADGQTVPELAKAQGVALEDLVDALTAPMIERIEQAVENGRLTQEQADERIETMKEHLLEQLESGFEMGRGGFGGRPGPMRGGRRGGKEPGGRFPGQMAPPTEQ